MAPHFHWFLSANGDGRDIVGGGHGVATGSADVIRPADGCGVHRKRASVTLTSPAPSRSA
jgi:hypothetical protein